MHWGRHPSEKTMCKIRKGVLAIPKIIKVTDTAGHILANTYPKRARGLVKHGRAVFLGSDMICLLPSKGVMKMSVKEALLSAIDQMSETQMQSLLVFLDTFQNEPAQVTVPSMTDARAAMLNTLQERMNALDYSSPNAENVLKELKDMLNMLLRV